LLLVNIGVLPVLTSLMLTLLVVVGPTLAAVYLNKWAVEIHGGPEVANAVAQQNGFRNLGQVIDISITCDTIFVSPILQHGRLELL